MDHSMHMNHSGHDMSGHEGHDMSGHGGHDMSGHAGHDMSGHAGHDMSGHAGHDMSGHAGHDMSGHEGHDMSGHSMHIEATTEQGAGAHAGHHSPFLFMGHGHGDGVLQAGVTEVLLFRGAATETVGGLVVACVVMVIMAVVLEYLRLLGWWLETGRLQGPPPVDELEGKEASQSSPLVMFLLFLVKTFSYFLGTCLMLITMTFNVYLIGSLAVGSAVAQIATGRTKRKLTAAARS